MGSLEIFQLKKPIITGVFRKKKETWCPEGDLNQYYIILIIFIIIFFLLFIVTFSVT